MFPLQSLSSFDSENGDPPSHLAYFWWVLNQKIWWPPTVGTLAIRLLQCSAFTKESLRIVSTLCPVSPVRLSSVFDPFFFFGSAFFVLTVGLLGQARSPEDHRTKRIIFRVLTTRRPFGTIVVDDIVFDKTTATLPKRWTIPAVDDIVGKTRHRQGREASDDLVVWKKPVKRHAVNRPAHQERSNLDQLKASHTFAKSPLFRRRAQSPDHKMIHFG